MRVVSMLVIAATLLSVWLISDAKTLKVKLRQSFTPGGILIPLPNVYDMTGLQPDGNNTSGGGIEPYYSIHSRRSTRNIVPCGSDNTLVSGEELIFQSENYPDNYPNSHTCSWSFTNADQNAKLIVVCDPFSTQKNKDKLMFEESGGSSNVAELPKVSGRYDRFMVTTTTNSLTVNFTTSRKDAFTGFSCTVASTENQDSTSSQPSSTTMPSSTTKPSCACGQVNTAPRIVGGTETEQNKYPWQVGVILETSGSYFFICGGTILTEWWILTAAHCVIDSTTDDLFVMVGAHFLDSSLVQSIDEIIVHENYVDSYFYLGYDIALLRTTVALDFSKDEVGPVCLPFDTSISYGGENAIIAGWGKTSQDNNNLPGYLMEAEVPVWTNAKCHEKYTTIDTNIYNILICAGGSNKDTCNGDSGGPLMFNNNGNYEVIGIVSFGVACGESSYPGVFTRVTSFLDWIMEKAGITSCSR